MRKTTIIGSEAYTQKIESCEYYYGSRPYGRNDSIPVKIESHQKACHSGQFDEKCPGCLSLQKSLLVATR